MEIPLDHNFPEPILDCLAAFVPEVDLVPIRRIDSRLPELDDRDLVIALSQLGYRGLVTLNHRMLRNPRELAAILATNMAVFAVEGVGHDPIRATGALLLDLPSAVRAVESGRGEIVWLRPRTPSPRRAWDVFKAAAERRQEDAIELYEEVRVTEEELRRPIIG